MPQATIKASAASRSMASGLHSPSELHAPTEPHFEADGKPAAVKSVVAGDEDQGDLGAQPGEIPFPLVIAAAALALVAFAIQLWTYIS